MSRAIGNISFWTKISQTQIQIHSILSLPSARRHVSAECISLLWEQNGERKNKIRCFELSGGKAECKCNAKIQISNWDSPFSSC